MKSYDEYLVKAALLRELKTHVYKYDKYSDNSSGFKYLLMSIASRVYSLFGCKKRYILDAGVHAGYRKELVKNGYKIKSLPISFRAHPNIYLEGASSLRKIRKNLFILGKKNVNNRLKNEIDKDYADIIICLSKKLKYDECIGLVLPSDQGFTNKVFIESAKMVNIPTLIFHHGAVPVVFEKNFFDATDYLVVWGEATKNAYISKGWNKAKVINSGNPAQPKAPEDIRCNLKSVLVCTKPRSHGRHQDSWESIKYIYEIRSVLEKHGVKHATLRTHPSENNKLYEPFLDDFYELSKKSVVNDIQEATIVIGPQSAFIVDSFFNGAAYIVYEPVQMDGVLYHGQELSPIFSMRKNAISVSLSLKELETALENPFPPSEAFIQSISASELDLSFLSDIVGSSDSN